MQHNLHKTILTIFFFLMTEELYPQQYHFFSVGQFGNNVLCVINKSGRNSIWWYDTKNARLEQALSKIYNPKKIAMIPGTEDFSYLENKILKIKRANKRTPETIWLDLPLTKIKQILWQNNTTGYGIATYKKENVVFSFILKDRKAEITSVKNEECTKINCIQLKDNLLAYKKYRKKRKEAYIQIINTEKQKKMRDTVFFSKDIQDIKVYSKEKILITVKKEGAAKEPEMSVFLLEKNLNEWTYKWLCNFSFPKNILYKKLLKNNHINALFPYLTKQNSIVGTTFDKEDMMYKFEFDLNTKQYTKIKKEYKGNNKIKGNMSKTEESNKIKFFFFKEKNIETEEINIEKEIEDFLAKNIEEINQEREDEESSEKEKLPQQKGELSEGALS